MAIDEAEGHIIKAKRYSDSAFETEANFIHRFLVGVLFLHVEGIPSLHEDREGHLTSASETNLDKIYSQIFCNLFILLIFVTANALLSSEGNNIVFTRLREEIKEVKSLRLSSLVPRDTEDLKWDLSFEYLRRIEWHWFISLLCMYHLFHHIIWYELLARLLE